MTTPSDKDQREHIQEADALTYEQLKARLADMDESQLKSTVTVYNSYTDEYEPVTSCEYSEEDDVLDAFHPFLIIQG